MLVTALTSVLLASPAAGPLLVSFQEVQPPEPLPARVVAGVEGHLACVELLLVTKK